MVTETSLEAYNGIKFNLGEKQLAVFEMLKNLETANNLILSKKLGWEINRVTPGVKELREMGVVEQESTRPCPFTGRMSMFWRIKK